MGLLFVCYYFGFFCILGDFLEVLPQLFDALLNLDQRFVLMFLKTLKILCLFYSKERGICAIWERFIRFCVLYSANYDYLRYFSIINNNKHVHIHIRNWNDLFQTIQLWESVPSGLKQWELIQLDANSIKTFDCWNVKTTSQETRRLNRHNSIQRKISDYVWANELNNPDLIISSFLVSFWALAQTYMYTFFWLKVVLDFRKDSDRFLRNRLHDSL